MAKFLVLLLLTCTHLAASATGSHSVDFCQDVLGCDDERVAEAQILLSDLPPLHAPSADLPHDCSCPSHHHSCSHHPLYDGRTQVSFHMPLASNSKYLSAPFLVWPSPPLEEPFQPPKA
ncbi:MAG: hypothetical protein AB7G93_20235 [Bdellovibrionales bacterium]